MKLLLFFLSTAIAITSLVCLDTLQTTFLTIKAKLYTTNFTTTTHRKQMQAATTVAKMSTRTIRKIFLAGQQSEGAGAVVRRSIGTPQLRHLSPFLMLDHFAIPPSAGFPDHPHRGQETITYLLSGEVDHEDFTGSMGTIREGDLQFMTAGRGVVHAEMPGQGGKEKIEGMQLWVDLPEELKMCEPRYRDLRREEIPDVTLDEGRVHVNVISGKSHGVDSVKDLAYTPVWILDITIQPGGSITQELPEKWNAFAYTLEGSTSFSSSAEEKQEVRQFHNVVFNQSGDSVSASVSELATERARFFLVAGQPLDQRVVQYGPFVMTNEEGVYQALDDYQGRKNGFERAEGWRSEIGKRMGN